MLLHFGQGLLQSGKVVELGDVSPELVVPEFSFLEGLMCGWQSAVPWGGSSSAWLIIFCLVVMVEQLSSVLPELIVNSPCGVVIASYIF